MLCIHMEPATQFKVFPTVNKPLMSLLFTIIGGFFYLLLANESERSQRVPELILSPGAVVVSILVFNLFGFFLLKVRDLWVRKIPSAAKQSNQFLWVFLLIAAILFLMHFSILLFVKWLAGEESFFSFSHQDLRFFVASWFVIMVIVALLLINHSNRCILYLYEEEERQREMAVEAQYRVLQNQLNPHFLFNCLNTLVAEIKFDPDTAVLFTQKLSHVYRYVLEQENKKLVTLKEELDILHAYLFLYHVRLGKCLILETDLPPGCFNAKLPALTLQLLIENIFKHNCINEETPMAVILKTVDGGHALSISNALHPKNDVQSSGKGLTNLSERYRLVCNKSIETLKTEHHFTVTIPLLYE